jgi:hypothetical protein
MRSLPQRTWRQRLQKVEAGATLYQSLNDASLAEFERIARFEVVNRSQRACGLQAVYNTPNGISAGTALRHPDPPRPARYPCRGLGPRRRWQPGPRLHPSRPGQGHHQHHAAGITRYYVNMARSWRNGRGVAG